jgi:protein-disulfide isomerase
MRRYLPFIIIGVVFLGALGAGLALYRSSQTSPATPTPPPTNAPNMFESYSPHVRGGNNAAVTLEEYGDYQCPPCGALFPMVKAIESQYGDRLRFVFRQYPLTTAHAHALVAAHAAEAAGLQGRFWEMHDRLYENQQKWSTEVDPRPLFINYARDVGLDVDRFIADMSSPQVEARVTADRLRGRSMGVTGTPTLFVNGRMMPAEMMTPEGIRKAIDTTMGKPGK